MLVEVGSIWQWLSFRSRGIRATPWCCGPADQFLERMWFLSTSEGTAVVSTYLMVKSFAVCQLLRGSTPLSRRQLEVPWHILSWQCNSHWNYRCQLSVHFQHPLRILLNARELDLQSLPL